MNSVIHSTVHVKYNVYLSYARLMSISVTTHTCVDEGIVKWFADVLLVEWTLRIHQVPWDVPNGKVLLVLPLPPI